MVFCSKDMIVVKYNFLFIGLADAVNLLYGHMENINEILCMLNLLQET